MIQFDPMIILLSDCLSTVHCLRITGQVSLGQVRLGLVRLRQVRLGLVRLGQVGFGQVKIGQVGFGQVRIGQVGFGQVRLGQVRLCWVGLGEKLKSTVPYLLAQVIILQVTTMDRLLNAIFTTWQQPPLQRATILHDEI